MEQRKLRASPSVSSAEASRRPSPVRMPPSEPADTFLGLGAIATDHPKNATRRLSAGDLKNDWAVRNALRLSPFAAAAATYDVGMPRPTLEQADALDGTASPAPTRAPTPPRRDSGSMSVGLAFALNTLHERAKALGALDVTIDTENDGISFTLPSAPNERHQITFNLEERISDTPSPKPHFFSLRVVPRYGTPVHCTLAQEALGVLQEAADTAYPVELGAPCKRVAIFDADSTRHLSKEQLVELFSQPGYDQSWSDAKSKSRSDCTRTPATDQLEASITAQCGVAFRIPDKDIGKAKMWCINDLRRAYFYEPLLERASHAFAAALNVRLNEAEASEKAGSGIYGVLQHLLKQASSLVSDVLHTRRNETPNVTRYAVKSTEQVGPAAYRIVYETVGKGQKDDEIVVDLSYRSPGSRKATSDIDCSVCIRPDHLVDGEMLRVINGYGKRPGLVAQILEELGLKDADFQVNFYPEGFMRDANMPSLALAHHVRTKPGLRAKHIMDRGAALLTLFRRKPEALDDCFGKERNTDFLMAADYALLREINNGADLVRHTRDILSEETWATLNTLRYSSLLLGEKPVVPATGEDGLARIPDILQKLRHGGPLEVIVRGPLSEAERGEVMRLVSDLRAFRQGLDNAKESVGGSPLATRVRHDLMADYCDELACVKKVRNHVLLQILRYEEGKDQPNFNHKVAYALLEKLSLLATDLTVAMGAEADDAYTSLSAMNKTVLEVQQNVPQMPDSLVDSAAVLDEARMVMAAPSVDDVLRHRHIDPKAATVEEINDAAMSKVPDVAKHLSRLLHIAIGFMSREREETTSGGHSIASLRSLQACLAEALAAEDYYAASEAIKDFGLKTDPEVNDFVTALALFCQPPQAAEEMVDHTAKLHADLMREVKAFDRFRDLWHIQQAKPGEP